MKKTNTISMFFGLALIAGAGCAVEGDTAPDQSEARPSPVTPVELNNAEVWDATGENQPGVTLAAPSAPCGSTLPSLADVDPQSDGVQVLVNAHYPAEYVWVRIVGPQRDTWYVAANGNTVTLAEGMNSLSAVTLDAGTAWESGPCQLELVD